MYIKILKRRNIVLEDKLDEKFRKVVFHVFGYRKGALSEALADAIVIWINKNSHRRFTKKSRKRRRLHD